MPSQTSPIVHTMGWTALSRGGIVSACWRAGTPAPLPPMPVFSEKGVSSALALILAGESDILIANEKIGRFELLIYLI